MTEFSGIARSAVHLEILARARRLADVPRPVLIRGERGVGKELVARYIHAAGTRRAGPFVALNCAAVSESLLEAEIYGHECGAFTGATETRPGKLEQADGGTLFLDEIGSMSAAFQDRILRVIEYREFERVRGTDTVRVDIRVVSATNADLEDLMSADLFRRDLYDRLSFVVLDIPPLRARQSEIPYLVVHFVRALHAEMPNLPPRTFSREAVAAMCDYHWPGNVRELKNVVERAYVCASADVIQPDGLPPEIAGTAIVGSSFSEKVDAYKRQLIVSSLADTAGHQQQAARNLHMTYDQFRHYYRKFVGAPAVRE